MVIAFSAGGSGSKLIDVFEHLDQLWNFDSVQSGDRNYAHSACPIRGPRTGGSVEILVGESGLI